MVNMSHNSYHRRPWQWLATYLLFLELHYNGFLGDALFDFISKICRHQGCRIKIQDLIDGGHYPQSHELGNQLVGLD